MSTLLKNQIESLIRQHGRSAVLAEMPILGIDDLTNLLRRNADMRALENDEAGILREAADWIRKEVDENASGG